MMFSSYFVNFMPFCFTESYLAVSNVVATDEAYLFVPLNSISELPPDTSSYAASANTFLLDSHNSEIVTFLTPRNYVLKPRLRLHSKRIKGSNRFSIHLNSLISFMNQQIVGFFFNLLLNLRVNSRNCKKICLQRSLCINILKIQKQNPTIFRQII